MSLRVHCDVCSQVINGEDRLVVRCGRAAGGHFMGCTDEDEIDVCRMCFLERQAQTLAAIVNQAGLATTSRPAKKGRARAHAQ